MKSHTPCSLIRVELLNYNLTFRKLNGEVIHDMGGREFCLINFETFSSIQSLNSKDDLCSSSVIILFINFAIDVLNVVKNICSIFYSILYQYDGG